MFSITGRLLLPRYIYHFYIYICIWTVVAATRHRLTVYDCTGFVCVCVCRFALCKSLSCDFVNLFLYSMCILVCLSMRTWLFFRRPSLHHIIHFSQRYIFSEGGRAKNFTRLHLFHKFVSRIVTGHCNSATLKNFSRLFCFWVFVLTAHEMNKYTYSRTRFDLRFGVDIY